MKNKVLFSLALLLLAGAVSFEVSAQNKEIQSTQLYRLYQMKYIFARKYNDNIVAKDALFSMIAMDPTDDSLKLQLCYYYFENGQYASSLFASADIIGKDPENIDALRVNAMSYERMGVKDKAVDSYESLYLKTNDIGVLYQVVVLQFDLKRYTECMTNLDIILKDPQAKALKLKFAKSENEQQEVTLEAAAYNVKGMVAKQQGNLQEARNYFNKALSVQPDFALAQQNLNDLGKNK